MANGDILDQLGEKIETLLANKKIKGTDRTHLEIQQLFLVYLKDDHKKVTTMWAVYKPMAWGISIAAATFIGLLASGRITILLK